jgi:hypothetical protein
LLPVLQILVLVEGIEPLTSCTLQCRHWYICSEDVDWNCDFRPCVSKKQVQQAANSSWWWSSPEDTALLRNHNREFVVDCEQFHEVVHEGV